MKLPSGKTLPAKEFTARDVKFTFDCILNQNIEAASHAQLLRGSGRQGRIGAVQDQGDGRRRLHGQGPLDEALFPGRRIHAGKFRSCRGTSFRSTSKGEPISFDFGSKEFADGFNNHWANKQMCGTGPLIFKEWKKEDGVTLDAESRLLGPAVRLQPRASTAASRIRTPALQLVLQNELDWSAITEKDLFLQSFDNPNVKDGQGGAGEIQLSGYRYVGYNQKRDFFKDKRVRWAMSHAIPVDQIIDKVYHGLAERLTGPFLPGSSSYDSSLKPVAFDLDKARQLLDEAGWKDSDGDGVRDKEIDGKRVPAEFDLIIYSESPQFLTIAEIMKENCRQIGVDVRISPTKWALMLQKLRKKEFDACILGWAMSWKSDPFQILHGSQADVPDSSNSHRLQESRGRQADRAIAGDDGAGGAEQDCSADPPADLRRPALHVSVSATKRRPAGTLGWTT